jgi:PAS domain-containing protein
MDQILIFINNWGTIIAGIFTASGTIYLFVKRFMKKLKPHLEILDNLKKLTLTVNEISKEFKRNSGKSLKDDIFSLQVEVKTNTELTKRIENRQNLMLNLSEVPHFETDMEGNCLGVNDAYVNLIQRPKEELLGGGWILGILEEDREIVLKEWNEAVKNRRNFEKTLSVISKNNQEYLVKCVAIRQSDSSGYLGYYSNVTKA